MPDSRLLLVDGTGVIFRGFYAIRNLSTRDGVPTNAVFGFVRMLRQMVELWQPSHVVVVLDGGKPQKRLELLPDYKANRSPAPDELKSQMPLVEEFLDCNGTTWVREQGQEADDVIATLCRRAAGDGADVLIATSDKDMLQLVGGPVQIVSVSGKAEALGVDGVRSKTGVMPDQIVDWLALIGDSVDNIPGVKGVGPKTAAQLLDQFGNLTSILEHLDDISRPKLREALEAARDDVRRNVSLVRLDDEVDCEVAWESARVKPGNVAALLAFFERLELESLAKDLREPDLFSL